jgi:hypothetical protein
MMICGVMDLHGFVKVVAFFFLVHIKEINPVTAHPVNMFFAVYSILYSNSVILS